MSDHMTTERLRELAAGATLYGHERNAMAAELLAKREECASLWASGRALLDSSRKLLAERDAARAEAKKYHDALVARHGGEPVALLSELDEARAEVERLQGIIDDTESESGLAALQIDESLEEHPTLPDFVKHIVEERVAYGEEADALSKEAKKLRAHVEALQSWQDGIIIACGSLGLQPSEVAAHIEKLRGIKPGMPERISAGARFGIRWNGPQSPLAVPMDDGYWTPWHVANAEAEKLRADLQAMTVEAMRAGKEANELHADLDAWRSLGTEGEPVAAVVERLRHVMEEHAQIVSCNYEAELAAVKRQLEEVVIMARKWAEQVTDESLFSSGNYDDSRDYGMAQAEVWCGQAILKTLAAEPALSFRGVPIHLENSFLAVSQPAQQPKPPVGWFRFFGVTFHPVDGTPEERERATRLLADAIGVNLYAEKQQPKPEVQP